MNRDKLIGGLSVILLFLMGYGTHYTICKVDATDQPAATQAPTVEPVLPVPPGAEAELLWVSPEGVKVYRVKHEKLLVPLWITVSPGGQVSIR